jgi:hypothetical protein
MLLIGQNRPRFFLLQAEAAKPAKFALVVVLTISG